MFPDYEKHPNYISWDDWLNNLGKEGWELVQYRVTEHMRIATFKQEAIDD